MHQNQNHHPVLTELKSQAQKGKISRREFLRYGSLLGLSMAAAAPAALVMLPKNAYGAVYGGKLKISSTVPKIIHPARISRTVPSQILRQVAEPLALTDQNNITHPLLLRSWEVGEDLQTWTLHLRKNILFNNRHELTADDVIFSMQQWLDPTLASPLRYDLGAYLEPFNIEKIDPYQIRLHLNRPEIMLPEHLSHYAAVILNHRTFEGDFVQAPHGTGPFTIEIFEENRRCLLTKRNTYWRPGLPFLDQLDFVNVGWDIASQAAALKAGKIHVIDPGNTSDFEAYDILKSDRSIQLASVLTAGADVIRMRIDREPWTSNVVRRALKLCQHREKILLLAHLGQGVVGHDCHVCPSHPEYCSKKIPKYNPLRARSLLEEAGFPQGLDVHLTIGDGRPEIARLAQVLQKDAARAGFRIHIQEISEQIYQDNWTTFDFGITFWPHQPLGIQALNLAYAYDAEGNPGSWNETCWVDEEFQLLLDQANRTIDVGERKRIFCKLEEIQMNRGSIGLSCWHNNWVAMDKTVQGLLPHPSSYLILDKVWIKK